MSVQLVGTGVTFPDGTTQTTASTGAPAAITYDQRGTLRSTTPSANLSISFVEGLGSFTYYATGQSEPDDDVSAFLVSGGPGMWILSNPAWEYITSTQQPDWDYLNNQLNAANVCQITASIGITTGNTNSVLCRWPGRIVYQYNIPNCCVTCLLGSGSFCISVPCVGTTDVVTLMPSNCWYNNCCSSSTYPGLGPGALTPTIVSTNCIAVHAYTGCNCGMWLPCYFNIAIYKCS
jgi:hypothetical protein